MVRKQVRPKQQPVVLEEEVEVSSPELVSLDNSDAEEPQPQAATSLEQEEVSTAPLAFTLTWKEAIETGNIHAIRYHLEQIREQNSSEIIDLDLQHSETGATALMLACLAGQKDIVESILDLSSETLNRSRFVQPSKVHHSDLVDQLGNTALHLACRGGDLYIVILLIASLQTKPGYDQLPKTLPEAKYVNKKNHKGSTPLMYAAHRGHLDVVKHLVEEHRANLKSKNQDEQTATDLCRPKYAEEDYADNRHALVHDYLTQRTTATSRRDMFKVIFVTLVIPMAIVSLFLFVVEPALRRRGVDPMAVLRQTIRSLLLPR